MKRSRLIQIAADIVAATRRKLPPEVREASKGVAVHFEEAPSPEVLAEGFEPDLLGLFTGAPWEAESNQSRPLPPQIQLYIPNLWDYAGEDVEIFRDEVRLTYLHELGHYLGWDEDEVAARGLD